MKINFKKGNGLVPAIVQDFRSNQVLMLGYMNKAALEQTLDSGYVTFFSRSRNKLWVKGETSGNKLILKSISADCDSDTVLIHVIPTGPVCHRGTETCFDQSLEKGFLYRLEEIIQSRKTASSNESYTASLFYNGWKQIAQKVGEEAVEVILEAGSKDTTGLVSESADLLYHLLVLLAERDESLHSIEKKLYARHFKMKG